MSKLMIIVLYLLCITLALVAFITGYWIGYESGYEDESCIHRIILEQPEIVIGE